MFIRSPVCRSPVDERHDHVGDRSGPVPLAREVVEENYIAGAQAPGLTVARHYLGLTRQNDADVMLGRGMRGHVRSGRHGEYEHVRDGAEISYQPLGGHSGTEQAFAAGNISDIEVRLALSVRVGHGDIHGESPLCTGSRNFLYGISEWVMQTTGPSSGPVKS